MPELPLVPLPSTAPLDAGTLYPPVTLPPLTKGWAKGSHKEFIDSFQDEYTVHRNQSATNGKEFANVVVDKYFIRYYWNNLLDEEPTKPPPPPHLDVIHPSQVPLKATHISRIGTISSFKRIVNPT